MSNSRNVRTGPPPPSNRTNEYFVPKEGIDREVITADICRYLGNDALVRPGTYENPNTRTVQAGYFITAYRNLTTEMIADLKADSARWDAERKSSGSRGQPSGVEYRASNTHQSRQYYGPTDTASSGYAPPQPQVQSSPQVFAYSGDQYGQSARGGNYQAAAYPSDSFVEGGNFRPIGNQVQAQPQIPSQPRTTVYPPSGYVQPGPTYADSRSTTYYTPSAPGNVTPQQQYSTQQQQQQPSDSYYGRTVSAGSYDPPSDPYEGGGYTQAPSQSSTPAIVPPRNPREREPERDNRRHRHR